MGGETRFWSSLCWKQFLFFGFPSVHRSRTLKKTYHLFSNKLHISLYVWYQGRRDFFRLYTRRSNACKPVLLTPQLEKTPQAGFKDWQYHQWDFFAVFPLFEHRNSYLQSCSHHNPGPLFSLYKIHRESENYCLKIQKGILNNITAGTSLKNIMPNTLLLMAVMQRSWHSCDKFTPKIASVNVIGQCPKCLVQLVCAPQYQHFGMRCWSMSKVCQLRGCHFKQPS